MWIEKLREQQAVTCQQLDAIETGGRITSSSQPGGFNEFLDQRDWHRARDCVEPLVRHRG